jgi:hypothetical protein
VRAAAVCFLTALAFGVRLLRLRESPEPLGADAYYYVVQVEHLLRRGALHAPDASWVLAALAAVARPFRDPIAGIKVGEAMLAALCVPAAAVAGARLRSEEGAARGWVAGAVLALWAVGSPTLTQLCAHFPKSAGALAPGLLALAAATTRDARRRAVSLGAALLIAATAHKLGAALVGLALCGAALGAGLRRVAARDARPWIAAAVVAAGAFAVASALLPNLLHPADLERVKAQLTLVPAWPPPVPFFGLRPFPLVQRLELLSGWAALAAGAFAWIRIPERRPLLGALAVPLFACLFPFWRGDVLDTGYRLTLVSPALALPLLVLALPAPRTLPRSVAPVTLATAALAAGVVAAPFTARAGVDPSAPQPWARYRSLVAATPRPLPALLIAHPGLNFVYDHLTGHDAMAWAPDPGTDPAVVGRIAWGIRPGEWMAWAPRSLPAPVPLDEDYAYVREDVWRAFVARAAREGDDDVRERLADRRNPSAPRPESLLRNHRP